MGVSTTWIGHIGVSPALSSEHREFLHRTTVDADLWTAEFGRNGWVSTSDGGALVWDGEEKFNAGAEWLTALFGKELREHRGIGRLFGFCEYEWMHFDALCVDVWIREVTVQRFALPSPARFFDFDQAEEEPQLGAVFDGLAQWRGVRPDPERAAGRLDDFLTRVPMAELGELDRFLGAILADLGEAAQPVAEVFERHGGKVESAGPEG